MSQTASSGKSDRYRDADFSREMIDPEPEPVLVYACPLDDCEATSDSIDGFRMHLTRSDDHETSLGRATMQCASCGEAFETYPSGMHRAYCSRDCAFEDGRSGSPTVLDAPLEPDVSATVRYPCPVEDCDSVAISERGLRKHATRAHNGRGRITRDCEVCGETFHERASRASTAKYCSPDCLYESRQTDLVEKTCEQCGDVFEVYPCREDAARYCTYECSRLGRMKPRVKMACSWCGEEIERIEREEFDNRFCEKACLMEWLLEYREKMPTPNIAECDPEELGLSPFGESAPKKKLPCAPALLDVKVDREECLQWRQRALESGSLEAVADNALVPISAVEEHVTGACEHGFDIVEQPPLRNNGREWVSAADLWGGER